MHITIEIPSKQVVYFVLESANPRFKKNCKTAPAKVFVNTYFYKGTINPGDSGLTFPSGYMGNSLYHLTVGRPDYALPAGTHTLKVINWACEGSCNPLDYSLIVYQRGSGTVKIKY
jgi:hypothetical protein